MRSTPSQWCDWSDTKVLNKTIKEEIWKNIERAHRVQSKGTSSNESPPYLVVKMVNWEFSERVKSAFIQENLDSRSQVFVPHMYSESITLCRNQTLKNRYEKKEEQPSIQSYIRYPAILIIKKPGQKSIRLKRNFNFILCWHPVSVSFLLYSCGACENQSDYFACVYADWCLCRLWRYKDINGYVSP